MNINLQSLQVQTEQCCEPKSRNAMIYCGAVGDFLRSTLPSPRSRLPSPGSPARRPRPARPRDPTSLSFPLNPTSAKRSVLRDRTSDMKSKPGLSFVLEFPA